MSSKGTTASAPSRDGGAGHDADCVPGGYCDAGKLACGDCACDAECYGGVGGCAVDVGCLKGVAVHGGVVEGRDVVICEGVLGEHLPDCAQQGSVLGFQRVEVAQDAFERVFDVEHGFAVVAVAVTACVSPLSQAMAQCAQCERVLRVRGSVGRVLSCDFLLVIGYFGYSVCKYMPSAPPSPRGRGGLCSRLRKALVAGGRPGGE